jgi:hypothetical protein
VTISRNAGRIAAAALALAFAGGAARADDSFFDSLAKSTGLMATPPDPPDFIKASRPKTEPTSMPVFAAPDEPRSKVKSASELKAMDADLERASHAQDAIRPKLPVQHPSKKAAADRETKN